MSLRRINALGRRLLGRFRPLETSTSRVAMHPTIYMRADMAMRLRDTSTSRSDATHRSSALTPCACHA